MDEILINKYQKQSQLIAQLNNFAIQSGLSQALKSNYVSWVLRYIKFHQNQHPLSLTKADIEKFLSYLAVELNYDSLIQQQALTALSFLYGNFLKQPLKKLNYRCNLKRRGFSTRFGLNHCLAVINSIEGPHQLMAKLVVLANLKLYEVINLHLADINFKQNNIVIRDTSGNKKLTLNIPLSIILDLRVQVIKVHRLIQKEKQLQKVNNELTKPSKDLNSEQQYLFPFTRYNQSNNVISYLNETPKSILKNDIQLAIKSYLIFLPNKNQYATNASFSRKIKHEQNNYYLSKNSFSKNDCRYLQQSFNFEHQLKTA